MQESGGAILVEILLDEIIYKIVKTKKHLLILNLVGFVGIT